MSEIIISSEAPTSAVNADSSEISNSIQESSVDSGEPRALEISPPSSYKAIESNDSDDLESEHKEFVEAVGDSGTDAEGVGVDDIEDENLEIDDQVESCEGYLNIDLLAEEINIEHEIVEKLMAESAKASSRAVEHAYKAGKMLREAKERLPRGSFETWKTNRLKCSGSAAGNYMVVNRCIDKDYGDISTAMEICPDLSVISIVRKYRTERKKDKAKSTVPNARRDTAIADPDAIESIDCYGAIPNITIKRSTTMNGQKDGDDVGTVSDTKEVSLVEAEQRQDSDLVGDFEVHLRAFEHAFIKCVNALENSEDRWRALRYALTGMLEKIKPKLLTNDSSDNNSPDAPAKNARKNSERGNWRIVATINKKQRDVAKDPNLFCDGLGGYVYRNFCWLKAANEDEAIAKYTMRLGELIPKFDELDVHVITTQTWRFEKAIKKGISVKRYLEIPANKRNTYTLEELEQSLKEEKASQNGQNNVEQS